MDSWWTPGGLLTQFQEFIWTPDGVHQDAWLSVTTSKIESLPKGVIRMQGNLKPGIPITEDLVEWMHYNIAWA
jgi:hypothetical protein